MVRMLLQRGASVNLQDSSLLNVNGISALMQAASGGHTRVVQALLDAKADTSLQANNGSTALMLAENMEHAETAQLLRQHAKWQAADQAEAAAMHAAASAPTPNPATVLGHAQCDAAGSGDAHAVVAWLDEGGDVDACCTARDGRHSMTLLIAAAFGEQMAMVRMLLQRGASVNLQNSLGATALMAAAAYGQTTIVQALLDAKADASPQDTGGYTALMYAEQAKYTATAQLLRQHTKRQTAAAEAGVAASTLQETFEPALPPTQT